MPGPSNLYGVANAPVTISSVEFPADTPCPANVATTVASHIGFTAPSPGWFFPVIWLSVPISFGTTEPSQLSIGFNINGGSQVDFWRALSQQMVVSAVATFWPMLFGTPSNTAWAGAGSTINIIVNPSTNPVTCYGYSFQSKAMLFRAPDQ